MLPAIPEWQDPREQMAPLVPSDQRELQDLVDRLVQLEHQDRPEVLALLDLLVRRERKQVLPVHLVNEATRVPLDLPGHPVRLACLDHLELMENQPH